MRTPSAKRRRLPEAIGELLVSHSGWAIIGTVALTGLLVVPWLDLPPTEQASQNPTGPVFDLQDKVNQRFPPRMHIASFIVEDRRGDILRQESLWELYQAEQRLRESDLGDLLYNVYDVESNRQINGVSTIADAVQNLLLLDPRTDATLETATDEQIKEAVHRLFASPAGESLRPALSRDAVAISQEVNGQRIDSWRAKAMLVFVALDNQLLGGGPAIYGLVGDEATLGKERINRRIQEVLRGQQASYRMWGIALDPNLEAMEQGATAFPYVAVAIILVSIVVAVALRSPALLVMTPLGLLMVLVWLKGWSNLVGLKSSLTLDLIVPIAMISLGVDFLVHALSRYREELQTLEQPGPALIASFAGVAGALTLAMLSDGIAFLANMTSGIETIIGFGLGAGIAVASSYLIMGVFLPLVVVRLRLMSRKPQSASAGTALHGGSDAWKPKPRSSPVRSGFGSAVVYLAKRRAVLLPAVALLTVVTTYLALQLEAKLDVKEFFISDSDLVVGLDKLDQHTQPTFSGEPAVIYIEGDLTQPRALRAITNLLERLSDNDSLARTEEGRVSQYSRNVLDLLGRTSRHEYARSQVEDAAGIKITDADADGIPDSGEQVRAVYDYIAARGIPLNPRSLAYDPQQVRSILSHGPTPVGAQATILVIGVLNTREQSKVVEARKLLLRDLALLEQEPSIAFVGLTGTPFTRQATLDATTRALNVSLPVAVAACFALLLLWTRSGFLALVTIIPIALVVSWLYALMYLAGFHLNFITATIAAVSIGVGIDFSIHMTERFRQELARWPGATKEESLMAASKGAGVALAGSAASSIVGFGVLAFAPMPIVATYGILTAAMIFLAAVASLLVLPSLLMLCPLKGDSGGVGEAKREVVPKPES